MDLEKALAERLLRSDVSSEQLVVDACKVASDTHPDTALVESPLRFEEVPLEQLVVDACRLEASGKVAHPASSQDTVESHSVVQVVEWLPEETVHIPTPTSLKTQFKTRTQSPRRSALEWMPEAAELVLEVSSPTKHKNAVSCIRERFTCLGSRSGGVHDFCEEHGTVDSTRVMNLLHVRQRSCVQHPPRVQVFRVLFRCLLRYSRRYDADSAKL